MTAGVGCKFTVHFSTSFFTTSLPQTKLRDSAEEIRYLLSLIRRAALFSSQPAPPNSRHSRYLLASIAVLHSKTVTPRGTLRKWSILNRQASIDCLFCNHGWLPAEGSFNSRVPSGRGGCATSCMLRTSGKGEPNPTWGYPAEMWQWNPPLCCASMTVHKCWSFAKRL